MHVRSALLVLHRRTSSLQNTAVPSVPPYLSRTWRVQYIRAELISYNCQLQTATLLVTGNASTPPRSTVEISTANPPVSC